MPRALLAHGPLQHHTVEGCREGARLQLAAGPATEASQQLFAPAGRSMGCMSTPCYKQGLARIRCSKNDLSISLPLSTVGDPAAACPCAGHQKRR